MSLQKVCYGYVLLIATPATGSLEWQDRSYRRGAKLEFHRIYNATEFGGEQDEMFVHLRTNQGQWHKEKLMFTEQQLERWVELGWFEEGCWRTDLSYT